MMTIALRAKRLPAAAMAAVMTSAMMAAPAISADADHFPVKPVRFIVPFLPGVGTDVTARTVAAKLAERWGRQVVVDNRAGAAGTIGVEATVNALPDGYTICLISASHAVNAATNPKPSYDLLADLRGLSQMTSLNYIVYVHPAVPAKTVQELIAYARSHPDKLNFGSSGTGGLQHLAGELFKFMAGVRLVHVPYKGGAQVNAEVMAGNIQLGFGTLLSRRLYQAGKLRPLGITAPKRSPIAPEIPTVSEQGVPGYEVDQWYGVVTSAKVPLAIATILSQAIRDAVQAPDVAQRWATDGTTAVGSGHAEFSSHLRAEVSKWRKVVKDTGLNLH